MVKGSCVCGDYTYEFQGEPLFAVRESNPRGVSSFDCLMTDHHTHAPLNELTPMPPRIQGICHCRWCRKTSGHNGNTFAVVMSDQVSTSVFPTGPRKGKVPEYHQYRTKTRANNILFFLVVVQAPLRLRQDFHPHRQFGKPHDVLLLREVQLHHVGQSGGQA
jgi:hypothetical protein